MQSQGIKSHDSRNCSMFRKRRRRGRAWFYRQFKSSSSSLLAFASIAKSSVSQAGSTPENAPMFRSNADFFWMNEKPEIHHQEWQIELLLINLRSLQNFPLLNHHTYMGSDDMPSSARRDSPNSRKTKVTICKAAIITTRQLHSD